MHFVIAIAALVTALSSATTAALSLGTAEFLASRQMACVLAQESLGVLSEAEYGAMTHDLLDDFDASERDTILAKALGYYDGLMFEVSEDSPELVALRLETFVASDTCREASLRQKVVFDT